MRILLTRPVEQSIHLKQLLEDKDFEVFNMPLIQIVTMDDYKKREPVDMAIYVSSNAVKYGFYFNKKWPALGIGESTTEALVDKGANIMALPKPPFTSESLLTLECFNQVKKKRIRIVKGEGGRQFLKQTLQMRGATVDDDVVYSRKFLSADFDKIEAFLKKDIQKQTVIATSVQLLEAMERGFALEQLSTLKKNAILICISSRVAEMAKTFFWGNILVSKQASSIGLLNTAIDALAYEKRR